MCRAVEEYANEVAIKTAIEMGIEYGIEKEQIIENVCRKFGISKAESESLYDAYLGKSVYA